jgi:hypothetical protein
MTTDDLVITPIEQSDLHNVAAMREMRLEAAALRRDIKEAQVLIDRLQLRYLNSARHAQPRRPVRHQAR